MDVLVSTMATTAVEQDTNSAEFKMDGMGNHPVNMETSVPPHGDVDTSGPPHGDMATTVQQTWTKVLTHVKNTCIPPTHNYFQLEQLSDSILPADISVDYVLNKVKHLVIPRTVSANLIYVI